MHKIKFIPTIALAVILSSCSLFGSGKAPKFDNEGDEVDKYSDFYDRAMQAINRSEIMDSEARFTDRTIKTSFYESRVSSVKRDRKEISKSEYTMNVKGESQYDVDNLVGKLTEESKQTSKGNDQEGNGSYTYTAKGEGYYQFEKPNGSKALIYANTKTQQYSIRESVSSSRKQENIFDDLIRSELNNLVNQFYNYIPGSSNDAKDYLFYIKDDSLFTISLTKESSSSNENYDVVTKTKLKVQFDVTDKKQSLKVSSEIQNEYTYNSSENGHKKYDVQTENNINYREYTVSAKSINVSAIDTSDYYLSNSYSY